MVWDYLYPVKRIRNLVNRLSGAHASFYFNDVIGRSPLILEAVQTANCRR